MIDGVFTGGKGRGGHGSGESVASVIEFQAIHKKHIYIYIYMALFSCSELSLYSLLLRQKQKKNYVDIMTFWL